MTRTLTWSALRTFADCPYQWYLRHDECLRPIGEAPSEARDQGKSFHEATAILLRDGLEAAIASVPAESRDDLRNIKTQAMLQFVWQYRDVALPRDPIAIEMNMPPVSLKGIRGFNLSGRVDALEPATVWEFKTVDNFANSQPLQYDFQGLLYLWMFQHIFPELTELKVLSICRPTLRGRNGETVPELLLRMALQRDPPSDWVRVEGHTPAPSELRWAEQQVRDTVSEIRWARSKRGVFRKNWSACFRYKRKCAYYPLCWSPAEEYNGIVDAMFQHAPAHPELMEPETRSAESPF